ncbi:MAG: 8-oxo-dGTP diphosphatase, partial [Akkermansiaceae bacterium]|nr:8-oxo-dGTP diphosphatase [Akkermansiaceae bacterium]
MSKDGDIESVYDWDRWDYGIHATLMFIMRGDEVLLIEKKRGLGAGKVNGPGGKIDPGETPLEAVIRETQEELCVTPHEPRKLGELWFVMSHVPNIRCHVYRAEGFEGTPTETDEAVPLWTKLDAIPYERMWEDDRHWMPHLLEGANFHGR